MKQRSIAVSNSNYKILKRLGNTADSFDDVITDLMRKAGVRKERHHDNK